MTISIARRFFLFVCFGFLFSGNVSQASPVSWVDPAWVAGLGTSFESGAGTPVAIYSMVQTPPDKVGGVASATISDYPAFLAFSSTARATLAFARRFVWSHLDGQHMELSAHVVGGNITNTDQGNNSIGNIVGSNGAVYIGKLDPTKNCTASQVASMAPLANYDECFSSIVTYHGIGAGGFLDAGDYPFSESISSLSEDLGSGLYVAVGWIDALAGLFGEVGYLTGGQDGYARSVIELQLDVNRAVPEPTTLALVALGIAGAGFVRRKVRRRSGIASDQMTAYI